MSGVFPIFKTHYSDSELRHKFTSFTESLKKRFITLKNLYAYVYLSVCMHMHMPVPSEVRRGQNETHYKCSSKQTGYKTYLDL